jgi:hypothetical protein
VDSTSHRGIRQESLEDGRVKLACRDSWIWLEVTVSGDNKKGEWGIDSFRSEACGDSSVEDVHYVSGGAVDDNGVSIICPDRESCVADCDRVDVVAKVRSDVDSSSAPIGGNS